MKQVAVLLDLSSNESARMEWASARLPETEIRLLDKAELKWASNREALSRIRSLRPDVFSVFVNDWSIQSRKGALMLFGMLTGASAVVIGDESGFAASRSRIGILLLEAPRFAIELLAGYGLLVPLSWLLTEGLMLSQTVRQIVRASRMGQHPDRANRDRLITALYIRATMTSAAEGGMPTHVAGFASGAAAIGHRLEFLVSGVTGSQGDTVTIAPSPVFSATKALYELWNNIVFTVKTLLQNAAFKPEINLIYQRYSRFNWTGVVLSAMTGLPLALEYNGSEVWISRHWDPSGLVWLLRRFERLNLRAADLVFVVSDVERNNLIETGLPTEKIIVNPNGVDTDRFRPKSGGCGIRRELGVNQRVVVGFVGTFGPWHGAPVLAKAATQIDDPSHYHFVFIGAGEQRAQTELIIKSAEVNATFTGSVPHDLVPAHLDACDILVSPHVRSTDGTEFFGSPTKLFEYLAMGKGIVASRLGQVGEVIVDGENGLLVEPGDAESLARAIERLTRDDELRARLGATARKTALDRYTWRHNASRVFDAFASMELEG